MRLIKTTLVAFSIALGLQAVTLKSFAQKVEELKIPAQFEILKGQYKLTSAEGPAKDYCSSTVEAYVTQVELSQKLIPIMNVSERILMPVANLKNKFSDPANCITKQEVRLLEQSKRGTLAIHENVIITCSGKIQISDRFLEYEIDSKKLTFRSKENRRMNARCEWRKE